MRSFSTQLLVRGNIAAWGQWLPTPPLDSPCMHYTNHVLCTTPGMDKILIEWARSFKFSSSGPKVLRKSFSLILKFDKDMCLIQYLRLLHNYICKQKFMMLFLMPRAPQKFSSRDRFWPAGLRLLTPVLYNLEINNLNSKSPSYDMTYHMQLAQCLFGIYLVYIYIYIYI